MSIQNIFFAGLIGFFASGLVARIWRDEPQLETALTFIGGTCLLVFSTAAGTWLLKVCLQGYKKGRLRVLGEWEHDTRVLSGKTARIVSVIGMAAAILLLLAIAATLMIVVIGRFAPVTAS